jgi:hypothetical protein
MLSASNTPQVRPPVHRARLLARLSCLWALGSVLFPGTARASDEPSYGGGFFLGCTFGDQTNFEGGVEGYGTRRLDDVPEGGQGAHHVAGGLVQLAWRPGASRITAAGLAGTAMSGGVLGASGELGVTYRFGQLSGFGIHTGVTTDFAVLYGGLRHQFLLGDTWVGGGLRLPPFYGSLGVRERRQDSAVGRPLRTDEGVLHCDAGMQGKPRDERELAAQRWQDAAQHECESVPAFLRLAEELLFHDAPDELVARALDAAEDEIRHAALSAVLARALHPAALAPRMPLPTPRVYVPGERGLRQLATESVLDGLIGEGMAAERARLGAEKARDPRFASAQRRIHTDESRHAALGGDVARWAAQKGGDAVRDALADLRAVPPVHHDESVSSEEAHHYGLLRSADMESVAERMACTAPKHIETLIVNA